MKRQATASASAGMTTFGRSLPLAHRIARGLLVAAGLSLPAAPVLAQGPPPRATVAGTAATFQAPLGLWDAEAYTVRMIFPTRPLPADVETVARRDGGWPTDGGGPMALVELVFAAGKYSAAMSEVESCAIELLGFREEPMEISGAANACHLVSTGGRLQPAGMLMGLIEGAGKGYDLRLPFMVMFPAEATSADAAAPAAAPALPPMAPNTVSGTGTYSGQTLTFTHGLAWMANDRLEVALFEHAPRPGILAELQSGTWGEGGPAATLSFMLDPAKTGPAALTYCFVNLTFPKGGPMSYNVNTAAGCGLTAIGGTLAPGGALTARLAGSAAMRGRPPMAWQLAFHLPLAR